MEREGPNAINHDGLVFVPGSICTRMHWKLDVPPTVHADSSDIAVCNPCWQRITYRMLGSGQTLTDAFWDVYVGMQYVVYVDPDADVAS